MSRDPTNSINSPRFVAAEYIALSSRNVHSTRWSQMLAENRDFCLPHLLHSTPPLVGSPSEYCHHVWYGKTRVVWLPDGEKNCKIYLVISTESTNVTSGQTDTPHRAAKIACERVLIYSVIVRLHPFLYRIVHSSNPIMALAFTFSQWLKLRG